MKGHHDVRNPRIAGGALAVAAAAVSTVMLLGATPALAQDQRADQAYALGAAGLLDIPPTPYVRSADGQQVTDEVLGLGGHSGAVDAGLAVGALTVEAEAGRAESSVADLRLFPLLHADIVRTWCDGGEAGLEIVGGSVLGQPLPDLPAPDTEIDLSPVLNLRLNAQARNVDGSLTVHGLQLVVLPGADDDVDEPLAPADLAAVGLIGDVLGVDLPVDEVVGLVTEGDLLDLLGPLAEPQVVVVGHATCSDVVTDASTLPVPGPGPVTDSPDTPGSSSSDEPAEVSVPAQGGLAPAPTVVTAYLPVTG